MFNLSCKLQEKSYFATLPNRAIFEIERICASRKRGADSIGEIHLCKGKRSSILSHGERIYLGIEISAEEIRETVERLCGGALYAHRETLKDGYISANDGIRVGVCGEARYESGRLVGISEFSSLVYRVPTEASSVREDLYRSWQSSERGMLIYSKPGGGKTTALRSLIGMISKENGGMRVAVIDERGEFSEQICSACGADLFRGYRRCDGMEIALRTMSPDVIVIDEIGARRESEEMLDSLNSGVRILATAHAKSFDDVKNRRTLVPFLEREIFDVFVGIFNTDGNYFLKTDIL